MSKTYEIEWKNKFICVDASFDYFDTEWTIDERSIMILDGDEYDSEWHKPSNDDELQDTLDLALDWLKEYHTPSYIEIESYKASHKGNYDYDEWSDAQLDTQFD